jgi:ferredoxin
LGYRLQVDRTSCQSSGRCIAAAPERFELDEDRLARLRPGAPEASLDEALAVARGCPALAIEVLADDGEPIDW